LYEQRQGSVDPVGAAAGERRGRSLRDRPAVQTGLSVSGSLYGRFGQPDDRQGCCYHESGRDSPTAVIACAEDITVADDIRTQTYLKPAKYTDASREVWDRWVSEDNVEVQEFD